MTVEDKRKFLIDTAFVIVAGAIFYFVLRFCLIYLLPFVIGLLLAVIVQRPAAAAEKKTKIKKGVLSVVFVLVLYLLVISFISFLVFFAYDKISDFISALPGYVSSLEEVLGGLNTKLFSNMDNWPERLSESVKNLPDTLLTNAVGIVTNILSSSAAAVAKSGPGLLVSIIVTVVASCYIAKDYDMVMKFVRERLSDRLNEILSGTRKIFFNSILKLGKSYLLLMMITFAELSIGLLLIGVKNPVSVAALIAFVDILPVLGTGSVVIPWAIICLVTGHVWKAVWLAVLYLVITVVRNFLEPKIVGDQVGLHPLLMLFTMFVGLRLFGILGMFALPVCMMIVVGLEKEGIINILNLKKQKRGDTPEK